MKYNTLFEQFKNKKILVIGDVMLDSYVLGKVNRISPEAPVPIISLKKKENRLGGAGNVALNLKYLGAQPIIASVIGKDIEGQTLIDLFDKRGISTVGIVLSSKRKTTVKTRVISSKQQLLRIDSEDTHPLNYTHEMELLSKIESILKEPIDAIILEDYDKGVLGTKSIQKIISMAQNMGIPITADPKKNHFQDFHGLTLFKPNLKELKEGLNTEFSFLTEPKKFEQAVANLRKNVPHQISLITLSEHGIYICDDSKSVHFGAHKREITDVSGAGDTVIAVATLCLISGGSISEIAQISNIAGGMVCEKPGVVSVHIDELKIEVDKLLVS